MEKPPELFTGQIISIAWFAVCPMCWDKDRPRRVGSDRAMSEELTEIQK
jgi:hypothetical protein